MTKIIDGYTVKSDGSIYSPRGKKLRQRMNNSGYMIVDAPSTKTVHRMVASAFIEPIDGKSFVNHIDGNKTNNDVSNLEWVTHSENIKHSWDNGRVASSKQRETIRKIGSAKKTDKHKHNLGKSHLSIDKEMFEEIKKTYIPNKFGVIKTAKLLGVSTGTVQRTIEGEFDKYFV